MKNEKVKLTMVSNFYKANADYGTRLAKAVNVELDAVKAAAEQLKE